MESGEQYLLPSIDGASACAAGVADKLPVDLRVRERIFFAVTGRMREFSRGTAG